MSTTRSLFAAQEEAEDKVLVDGVRLFRAHVGDFTKLRRVLGLTAKEAKVLIEAWDSVEAICAQACMGLLLPVQFGRLVNERFEDLMEE